MFSRLAARIDAFLHPDLFAAASAISELDLPGIAKLIADADDGILHRLFPFETEIVRTGKVEIPYRASHMDGEKRILTEMLPKLALQPHQRRLSIGMVERIIFSGTIDAGVRSRFYLKIAPLLDQNELLVPLTDVLAARQKAAENGNVAALQIYLAVVVAVLRHGRDANVRQMAAALLKSEKCGGAHAEFVCGELGKRIADEPEVRKEVAESLETYGKYAIPALCDLLLSDHKFTAHAALALLMPIALEEAKRNALDGGAVKKMRKAGFGAHAVELEMRAGRRYGDAQEELLSMLFAKKHLTAEKACGLLIEGEKKRIQNGSEPDGKVLCRLSAAGLVMEAESLRSIWKDGLQKPVGLVRRASMPHVEFSTAARSGLPGKRVA
jgi:hypothetical protein